MNLEQILFGLSIGTIGALQLEYIINLFRKIYS